MDDFSRYKMLIMDKLESQTTDIAALKTLVTALHTDMVEIKTAIKVRQSVYSFLWGAVGTVLGLLISWVKK